jgi:hypothetical protein
MIADLVAMFLLMGFSHSARKIRNAAYLVKILGFNFRLHSREISVNTVSQAITRRLRICSLYFLERLTSPIISTGLSIESMPLYIHASISSTSFSGLSRSPTPGYTAIVSQQIPSSARVEGGESRRGGNSGSYDGSIWDS